MGGVEVQRLRLRGPPARAALAAFRIEDALRTEISDDRLVVVRRVNIGRLPTTGRPRALPDQVGGEWRRILQNAAHGGTAGAGDANCVWFRDAGEARRILIARLAAGHRAQAWFWPLAVPDWNDQPFESWIASAIERHLAVADGPALFALIEALIAASATATLVRAFASRVPATDRGFGFASGSRRADVRDAVSAGEAGPAHGIDRAADLDRFADDRIVAVRVARIVARLPSAIRRVLARIATLSTPGHRAVALIAEAVVLRELPELRLHPARLATYIDEWTAQVVDPARHDRAVRVAEGASPPVRRDRRDDPDHRYPDAAQRIASARLDRSPRVAPPPPAPCDVATLVEVPAPPSWFSSDFAHESASPAAGLLLVIIPLIELGWREWIVGRPDLLGTAPGVRLIDHIAAHHRVAPDDPVRTLWEPGGDAAAADDDWLRLWRTGLDRWLRRTTRLNLSRLIWRAGWVSRGEDRIDVRFPANAADLALRRRALDRDPGWVDWLGISVRYAYRDVALSGAMR